MKKISQFCSFIVILSVLWAIGFQCCQAPFGQMKTQVNACHEMNSDNTSEGTDNCICHLSPAQHSFADFTEFNTSHLSQLQIVQWAQKTPLYTLTALTQNFQRPRFSTGPPPPHLAQIKSIVLII